MRNEFELDAYVTTHPNKINMYEVTCADTDTGSADSSDVPFEVEAVPAKGRVISSDERTSDWYYRQSTLLKGQDAVT